MKKSFKRYSFEKKKNFLLTIENNNFDIVNLLSFINNLFYQKENKNLILYEVFFKQNNLLYLKEIITLFQEIEYIKKHIHDFKPENEFCENEDLINNNFEIMNYYYFIENFLFELENFLFEVYDLTFDVDLDYNNDLFLMFSKKNFIRTKTKEKEILSLKTFKLTKNYIFEIQNLNNGGLIENLNNFNYNLTNSFLNQHLILNEIHIKEFNNEITNILQEKYLSKEDLLFFEELKNVFKKELKIKQVQEHQINLNSYNQEQKLILNSIITEKISYKEKNYNKNKLFIFE